MTLPATPTRLLLLWIVGCTISTPLAADAASHESGVALVDAAQRGNAEVVRNLLARDADPNATQADGMTALHWACHRDDAAMARALIAAGANVNAANRYRVTPLSLACTNGNGEIVTGLLKAGADANAGLHGGVTSLMIASRTGRLGAVRALLDDGAKIDAKERRGQTALMWAAAEGHAQVVDALIEAGADFKTPLKSGFTPLLFAARNGRIGVVRRLLAAGANANESMQRVEGGRDKPDRHTSPLMIAVENGHFELAVVLLEAGADPNDSRTGFAPLHALSWVRKPEIGDGETGRPAPEGSGDVTSLQFVRKLAEHGADLDLPKRQDGGGRLKISVAGTTPFLCAAATADVEYMRVLIELGADMKLTNKRGQTALMLAAGLGERPEADGPATNEEHLAAVKFLLDRGADIDATDHAGETAMHGAAYKMLPEMVRLLAERGADIKVWAKQSKQGRTPLSIAQGFRPGNFKPSHETIEAIEKIMIAEGITPPPPPKRRDESWQPR